jgi:hypothetical protein
MVSLFLVFALLSFTLTAFASSPPVTKEKPSDNISKTYFLPNGLRVDVSKAYIEPQTSSAITTYASNGAYYQNGSKTITISNQSKTVQYFSFSISGTFSVNQGVSVTCTGTSCAFIPIDPSWSLVDKYSYSNGSAGSSTAYGDVSAIQKFLFITINQVSTSVTLTCDCYGNVY